MGKKIEIRLNKNKRLHSCIVLVQGIRIFIPSWPWTADDLVNNTVKLPVVFSNTRLVHFALWPSSVGLKHKHKPSNPLTACHQWGSINLHTFLTVWHLPWYISSRTGLFAFNTWVNFHHSLNLAISYIKSCQPTYGWLFKKKNLLEFIIKGNLLNVKQKLLQYTANPCWWDPGQERIVKWISCCIHQSDGWAPQELLDISKNDGKTQFNLSHFHKG